MITYVHIDEDGHPTSRTARPGSCASSRRTCPPGGAAVKRAVYERYRDLGVAPEVLPLLRGPVGLRVTGDVMSVTVLSLFAGIGGLDLGLERAGMTVVGQVEISEFCRRVLARHWPEVPRHDDVRTAVEWWRSEPRPRVDVIAGGYPCQPESTAGRRCGTDDHRWLWPDMARIIHALRPRYVIGENVMGHRTKGLRFVLRDLADLGYTARAGIISAGEMGAPHLRKRIFVLAELADAEREHGGEGWAGRPARGGADRADVPAQPLADADGEAWRPEEGNAIAGASGEAVSAGAAESGGCGSALADAVGPRRRPGSGVGGSVGSATAGHGWWAAEPDVGRVAYGIPGRVDRLRGLGNAVVPQVAEHIGHLLLSGRWLDA